MRRPIFLSGSSVEVQLPLQVELIIGLHRRVGDEPSVERLEIAVVSVRPERNTTADVRLTTRSRVTPATLEAANRAELDGVEAIAGLGHERGLARQRDTRAAVAVQDVDLRGHPARSYRQVEERVRT